ncbi:TPA: hypothetical protein UM521_001860 [Stenotrophomonas maltophilia]|uniref:hypothetical protein n=1 Tax=Stenotrophomonas TaxID=40323 RepID=UPI00062223DE|nr:MULTISPECIES: hypothetical protein [Stenotrophomonas]EKT4447823.1 hypothetical protein [Stenotrophomonas maltophilia]KKF85864.1 hypothetical protein XY58_22290 [Stenotrophomonas maltophilia]MBA0256826.1 hypothetical protein [Stenotrophomonas maltophilia]MBA0380289.1 hypothetical protein [Stenotrophomonas maltophilia]MBA0408806.1 hypothetical protein [Stenotrophomonas maltophilia]
MALIALDDPRWAELQHAYGAADDIPELLANLSIPKGERADDDPIEDTWEELWSSLCHQGDVYSASFAAVPHIVDALLQQPELFMFNFIELPITIEIERREAEISIPELVEPEYSEAFQSLARFAASVILDKHDKSMSSALLTALALVHENTGVARMLGQITAYEADEAVDLFLNR